MRIIMGLALLALAGYLIWHGVDSAQRAKAEFESETAKSARDFESLQRQYPYSDSAIDARAILLESQIKARSGAAETRPGKEEIKKELKSLAFEIPDRTKKGVSAEQPYVHPDAAAIIGLAGLLLALVMPRTRFRGLAFLGLLLGGLAALAAMLPADTQVGLVSQFKPIKYVITSFPRVAQACLALGAITLITQVRRATARSSS